MALRPLHRQIRGIARQRGSLDEAPLGKLESAIARARARWPEVEWSWAAGPLALALFARGEDGARVLVGDEGIAPAVARARAAAAERAGRVEEAAAWRSRAARVEEPPFLP